MSSAAFVTGALSVLMHIAELFCVINKHNQKYILTYGILIKNVIMNSSGGGGGSEG